MENSLLLTVLIGCIVGLAAGMFGIGGSLIATPLLNIVVGLPPYLALGTPLPVTIPSALSGTVAYYKYGLIDFRSARYVLAGAIPTNILGVYSTKLISGQALMIMTGLLLTYVGLTFFIRGWLQREEQSKTERKNEVTLILTGICVGFLSGLLALGGGILMVPAFIRLNRMKLKKALATSLFCVALLAIPSSIGHFQLGHIDLWHMFALMLPAVPLSYLGARLAIAMRNKILERIFGTFIIIFATYFLLKKLL